MDDDLLTVALREALDQVEAQRQHAASTEDDLASNPQPPMAVQLHHCPVPAVARPFRLLALQQPEGIAPSRTKA